MPWNIYKFSSCAIVEFDTYFFFKVGKGKDSFLCNSHFLPSSRKSHCEDESHRSAVYSDVIETLNYRLGVRN